MSTSQKSYKSEKYLAIAIDPIHVGTGGSGFGRVDAAIVRDPVTRVPKIPGSSLAGVFRSYAAMAEGKFPRCAGLGQPQGHCCQPGCRICTTFGFARGNGGGFAGLAAFSDAHVLLFPVATWEGPVWITCPMAMRALVCEHKIVCENEIDGVEDNAIYREGGSKHREGGSKHCLNLGWICLQVKAPEGPLEKLIACVKKTLEGHKVPSYVSKRLAVVSDKLFSHVVNSNLEVRTSVAINPATGAAEEGALFTYEALPRATVLVWEVTFKNPAHFKVGNKSVGGMGSPDDVEEVVVKAHEYLEHLGIGGMGTRGMGRLRVLTTKDKAKTALATGSQGSVATGSEEGTS